MISNISLSSYLSLPISPPSFLDSNILLFQNDFKKNDWCDDISGFSDNLIKNYKNDFTNCIEVKSPDRLFKQIIDMQEKLDYKSALYIEASENNPGFFILRDSVHITTEKVGQGVESTVFRTKEISCNGNPIKKNIVKVAKKSYSNQSKLLDKCLSPNARKDPRIDHIQSYYCTNKPSVHLAICKNSDVDLHKFDYGKIPSPVKFIVEKLKEIAGGLAALHRNNVVHCDIKGANLLINHHGLGKVTDLGSIRLNTHGKKHTTSCTPYYAAPFIWDKLDDQISRKGYQGTEADVFSFGKTIQYDVIMRILVFLSIKHKTNLSLYNTIIHQSKIIDLSKDLQAQTQNHHGHVTLDVTLNITTAYLFPKREVMYKNTLASIKIFQSCITSLEFKCLNSLADLAFELQERALKKLPDMISVEKKLENILQIGGEKDNFEINESMHFGFEEKEPSSNSSNKQNNTNTFNPVNEKKEVPLNTNKRRLEELKGDLIQHHQPLQLSINQLQPNQQQLFLQSLGSVTKKAKIDNGNVKHTRANSNL